MLNHFDCVQLFVTLWTIAHQVPLSMGILQARILEWVAMPSFRGSSQPRDQTHISYVSCIDRQVCFFFLPLVPPGKPTLTIPPKKKKELKKKNMKIQNIQEMSRRQIKNVTALCFSHWRIWIDRH